MYSLCRNINNCTMNLYAFCISQSVFPLSILFFHFFFVIPKLLCCFNAPFLCVYQMGLLCEQVFRRETESSRYCVHLPLCIQTANLSLFPLKGRYRGYKLPPCGQSEGLLSLCCTEKRYQIVKLRLEWEVWTYYLFF